MNKDLIIESINELNKLLEESRYINHLKRGTLESNETYKSIRPFLYNKLKELTNGSNLFYAYCGKNDYYFDLYPYIFKGCEDAKLIYLYERYFSFQYYRNKLYPSNYSYSYYQIFEKTSFDQICEYANKFWNVDPFIALAYLLYETRFSSNDKKALKFLVPMINNLASINYDEFEEFSYQFQKKLIGYKRTYIGNKTHFSWNYNENFKLTCKVEEIDYSVYENFHLEEDDDILKFKETYRKMYLYIKPFWETNVEKYNIDSKLKICTKDKKDGLLLEKAKVDKKMNNIIEGLNNVIADLKTQVISLSKNNNLQSKSESFRYVYDLALKSLDEDINCFQKVINQDNH